ncbi:MAG: glycosyltransferase family 2 protein [Pseudomonadota bacterium]
MLSVIIPANNEAAYIGPCLDALLGQNLDGQPMEVIVAANACTDATVEIADGYRTRFADLGYDLTVLDIAEAGKPNALNRADAEAQGDLRAYLDADVICSEGLMVALCRALEGNAPRYVSGKLVVAPAQSWVTRRHAHLWVRLPFMTAGVPGAGLFAVNATGRARWKEFPQIISDDTYVRLHFTPTERVKVPDTYLWPMVEGFARLVRVRQRQAAGDAEIAARYPHLLKNEGKPSLGAAGHLRLLLGHPVSYAVYVAVMLAVRLRSITSGDQGWTRGR